MKGWLRRQFTARRSRTRLGDSRRRLWFAQATLDWVGKSSEFNSCLPADISSYKALPLTLPSLTESQIETSISSLGHQSPNSRCCFPTKSKLAIMKLLSFALKLEDHDIKLARGHSYLPTTPGLPLWFSYMKVSDEISRGLMQAVVATYRTTCQTALLQIV
jgi:hypothetical protein